MPATQFLHGVETIEVPSATQPIQINKSGVIGLVGTAPSMDTTVFVAAGCIRPSIPDRGTLDSIFGPGAAGRTVKVPDSVLSRLPRGFIARGHPLRDAGTLIRGPENRVRWITYHGGALEVTTIDRGG